MHPGYQMFHPTASGLRGYAPVICYPQPVAYGNGTLPTNGYYVQQPLRGSTPNPSTIPAKYSDANIVHYLQIRQPLQQYPEYSVDSGPISNIPDFKIESKDNVQQQELIDLQVIYADCSEQQQAIRNLLTSNALFNDDAFPANEEMMCGDMQKNSKQYQQRIQSLGWARFSQVYPGSELFKGGIRPSDLKQGAFGTCYFLVGLSALAERPQRIRDLFLTREVKRGFIACNLILRGRWKTVYVDDHFPFPRSQQQQQRGCSLGSDGQIWVSALEKAWAKLYGNYRNCESGFTEEGLYDLTGAHIKFIRPHDHDFDPEETWKLLLHGTEKRYAMICESPNGSDTNISESGMVFGHAYTLLGAYEVLALGQTVRLVKCRNPWGFQQWALDWHNTDPRWRAIDPNVQQKIGYKKGAKDGVFFMSYDNFYAWMKKITIAFIHDGNSFVYHTLSAKNGEGRFFKVTIFKKGWYSFQLSQTPAKLHMGKPNYNYTPATINIGKVLTNGRLQWKKGTQSAYRTAFRKLKLEAGEYLVYTHLQFQATDPYREVTLAICAEHYCHITKAPNTDTINFHERLFLSKGRDIAKPIDFNVKSIQEVLEYQGFLYAAVYNNSSESVKIRVKTCQNLNPWMTKPKKDSFDQVQVVEPKKEFILLERIPTCGVWTSNMFGIEMVKPPEK